MKKLVVILVGMACSSVVASASAEQMGDRGTVAVMGTGAVSASSGPDTASSSFQLFTPKVAWFFTDGISLSAGPRFMHGRTAQSDLANSTTTWFGGEVRVGGLVHLSDWVSLWPQIGIYADKGKTTINGVVYGMSSDGGATSYATYTQKDDVTSYGVSAEVPIILTLSKHTFASFSFASAGFAKTKRPDGPSSTSGGFVFNPQAGVGFGGWF